MEHTAKIAGQFEELQDDCFAYNERASVSILTSAATQSDILAIAEYLSKKKQKIDRRKKRRGYCDMWLYTQDRTWAFEFKQSMPRGKIRISTLESKIQSATKDTKEIENKESDLKYGVLMVNSFYFPKEENIDEFFDVLKKFSQSSNYAWKINSQINPKLATYFFFRQA